MSAINIFGRCDDLVELMQDELRAAHAERAAYARRFQWAVSSLKNAQMLADFIELATQDGFIDVSAINNAIDRIIGGK